MSVHTYACLLMKEKGLSQTELARRCGCTLTTINQILLGRRQSKDIKKEIAEILGFGSWDELEEASSAFLKNFSAMGGFEWPKK